MLGEMKKLFTYQEMALLLFLFDGDARSRTAIAAHPVACRSKRIWWAELWLQYRYPPQHRQMVD